jgi:hypothetical protein
VLYLPGKMMESKTCPFNARPGTSEAVGGG